MGAAALLRAKQVLRGRRMFCTGATVGALLASPAGTSPLALLGLLLAPGLAAGDAGAAVLGAAALTPGLSTAVGSSTAAAVAQALQVASTSPARMSLCADPEALGVQAAGSAAVLASMSAGGHAAPGAEQGLTWPWEDELFLNE